MQGWSAARGPQLASCLMPWPTRANRSQHAFRINFCFHGLAFAIGELVVVVHGSDWPWLLLHGWRLGACGSAARAALVLFSARSSSYKALQHAGPPTVRPIEHSVPVWHLSPFALQSCSRSRLMSRDILTFSHVSVTPAVPWVAQMTKGRKTASTQSPLTGFFAVPKNCIDPIATDWLLRGAVGPFRWVPLRPLVGIQTEGSSANCETN